MVFQRQIMLHGRFPVGRGARFASRIAFFAALLPGLSWGQWAPGSIPFGGSDGNLTQSSGLIYDGTYNRLWVSGSNNLIASANGADYVYMNMTSGVGTIVSNTSLLRLYDSVGLIWGTNGASTNIGYGSGSGCGVTSTLTVCDSTASTGATQLLVQGGAAAGDATTNQLFRINQGGGTTALMVVQGNGNLGIGTATPCTTNAPAGCVMSVNGTIQAKEVAVNTGWSDYVFDAGYHLTPLTEVADYIRANHHLPAIPSAKEVEEKGVGVGEMQSKLLAKIEELTLHMIEAEKENQALRERVSRLEHARDGE